jgi:hypothetical protein
MKTFFIISGIVLWSLIILFILYILYAEIKYRIRMNKLYKKALQELDEQEKGIMDKLRNE